MLFRSKDTIQRKTSLGNLFHLEHILALLFFRKIHRKKYSFCLRFNSYFLSDSASPSCGILSGEIHFGSYSLGYCLQHTRMLWIHVESILWLIRWNYWFWRGCDANVIDVPFDQWLVFLSRWDLVKNECAFIIINYL